MPFDAPHPRRRLPLSAERVHRAIVDASRRVAPEHVEGIAAEVHHRAGLHHPHPVPDLLAERLGFEVWREPGAPCGSAVLLGGVLVIRASHDARREGLSVLHEIAHRALRGEHSHGDVWLLTLALAVPPEVAHRPARELRPRAWVPGWAVDLRLAIRRAVREGR